MPTLPTSPYDFSPLLIGDRSAASRPAPLSRVARAFQSPPDRGSFCCDSALAAEAFPSVLFQSPPDRGSFCCTFRPEDQAAEIRTYFSPLLIGDRSAAATWRSTWARRSSNFSPLLIGDRSAADVLVIDEALPGHFSPLLIGDRSAAALTASGSGSSFSTFQSPPDRGSFCCPTIPDWSLDKHTNFSPLLIGDRSAAVMISSFNFATLGDFSPLLIGDRSAARRFPTGRLTNTRISVPS